jgi:hypothetical protein
MTKRKTKKRRIVEPGTRVEIDWNDAVSSHGWANVDEVKKCESMPVQSIGYIYKSDARTVTLIQSRHRDESKVADAITIPRAMITKSRILSRSHK